MKAGGRVREMALRGFVAAVLVLALAALDRFEVVRIAAFQLGRNDTQRPVLNAAMYIAIYLGGALAIAVVLCHRPRVRVVASVLVIALAAIEAGVAAVNGAGYTHHEAALLLT
jgi:hypothetical protein